MSWIERLRRWLESWRPRRSVETPRPAGPLPMVLRQLEATREVELSCDEVHAVLDQFAELVAAGVDAATLMPFVQHHLDHCPDCREEFEALMRVLRSAPGF